LKLALQAARDEYETRRERQRQGIEKAKQEGRYAGRPKDSRRHQQVIVLRQAGHSITATARITGYSPAQVKRILAAHREPSC